MTPYTKINAWVAVISAINFRLHIKMNGLGVRIKINRPQNAQRSETQASGPSTDMQINSIQEQGN